MAALPNNPLVIVNTLTSPAYAATPPPGFTGTHLTWGSSVGIFAGLTALGFPAGDMNGVDPTTYAISGIGSPGWDAGAATSVGEPVSSDYSPTATAPFKTSASTEATMLVDSAGLYHVVDTAAVRVTRYDQTGSAVDGSSTVTATGWTLHLADGSCRYVMVGATSQDTTCTSVQTPAVGSATPSNATWQLTVLSGTNLDVTLNKLYLNSGAGLANDLLNAAQQRDAVVLATYVGQRRRIARKQRNGRS